MDKPAAHAPAAKPAAGKPAAGSRPAPGGKPAAGATPAAGGKSAPAKGAAKPADQGKRVGGYSALSGWFMGLVSGVIVMSMTNLRPEWLFLAVGLPVVGVSFYLSSFLGGRLTKGWLPPGSGGH